MPASQKKTASASASTAASDTSTNAIALLKADHRKVTALFGKFEGAGSSEEKARLAKEICTELIVHTQLEEEIFYAACREGGIEDDLLDEAQVEHDSAKLLIAGLLHNQPDSAFYDARMVVLAEYIKHHVGEEEKPDSGIFARARAAKLDMNALGQRLQKRKAELMQQAQSGDLTPSAPRSLEPGSINRGKQEQSTMARQYDRDRDDQGRFASDDDHRGGRGYSSQNNGRQDNERDERGRFMSDDDRSGGRSNRDDDYRSSGRGSEGWRGSEGRGWSGDPEGHSRASQEGWENRGRSAGSSRYEDEQDYRSSSRGGSDDRGRGWFGDAEGHSRASEEGWENRGRSRSMSRDEDEGRYSSSRDSSGGRRGSWFGDSEGHSRASQEGWENRGGSRSSSSRDADYDDRNRGSGGRGGWFGDPRGHAEASRRGWQNR
jgi:hypothetical protein